MKRKTEISPLGQYMLRNMLKERLKIQEPMESGPEAFFLEFSKSDPSSALETGLSK